VLVVVIYVQWMLSTKKASPIAISLPELPSPVTFGRRYTGHVEKIGENDLVGPESLVVSNYKDISYMFAALGDGRIARIEENTDDDTVQWNTLLRTGAGAGAHHPLEDDSAQDDLNEKCSVWGGPADLTNTELKCGRPLGLLLVKRSTVEDHPDEDEDEDVLVVADSVRGLLMITGIYGNDAQMTVLATRANSDEDDYSFSLLNAAVQTPNGSLYVTETSTQFYRRRIFYAALEGRKTGRLLRYTKGQGMEVVADSLFVPNGIALSHDNKELLIISGVQVLRFSLAQQKILPDRFVHVLPGTGDNIKRSNVLPTGESRPCYILGLGSKYSQPFSLLEKVSDKPLIKAIIVALVPYRIIVNLIPKFSAFAIYDEIGNLVEVYGDDNATAPWISEVEVVGKHIYLGSWWNNFLGRVPVSAVS